MTDSHLPPEDPPGSKDDSKQKGWSSEGFGVDDPAGAQLNWHPKESLAKDTPPHEPLRGAALLVGRSPREVMERLHQGDPLELEGKCEQRIERRAMLMDVERLYWRATAYVAMIAVRDEYRGDPPLNDFLDKHIDESIDSLLEEDWAAEKRGEPIELGDPRYRMIAKQAGIEEPQARRVSLAFNTEPIRSRRLLFGALIKNLPLAKVARENAMNMAEAKKLLKKSMEKIFGARDWRNGQ